MPRRVVVTGLGLISPLGVGTQATWDGLVTGRSGAGPVTKFDAEGYAVRIAAEVKDFDPSPWFEHKEIKKFDTFVHYAVAASDMALNQSGLEIDDGNAERIGVVIGSGIGGFPMIERNHEALLNRGPKRVSPFFIPGSIINMCSGQVSIRTGAKGPNMATCTACSTCLLYTSDAADDVSTV